MADQEDKVDEQETEPQVETDTEADGEAEAPAAADESPVEAADAPEIAEAEGEPETEPVAAAEEVESEPEATAEEQPPAAEADSEPAAAPPSEEAAPQEELTYETLQKKTVAELRDIAQGIEHEALQGYSTMHKEHLVPALCAALGIEAHAHHEVVGINKDRVKRKIRDLKIERRAALESGDHAQLRLVRRRIKSLKRKIRRATV